MIFAMFLILQMELVVYHIVDKHTHPHEMPKWGHTSILHIDILGLVAKHSLVEVAWNASECEVLGNVLSKIPQSNFTKSVVA